MLWHVTLTRECLPADLELLHASTPCMYAILCCGACLQFTGEESNVSADSAGDDLYTWNVELWRTAFKPDCQLAKVQTHFDAVPAPPPILLPG